jgi:hypothetical protein
MAMALLLALIALVPLGPVTGQQPSMPLACEELAFSTEEDFWTHGPVPDGGPHISDGDLLSTNHTVCARNEDLVRNFDVIVDLGLDAADVIDVERYLVAFSTELDSPNRGQFTAGDLLVTNGLIIPNVTLTYRFQLCETVDQAQPEADYGFWFEDDVIRWQEFVPSLDNVTSIEIIVGKNGAPGDVLIEVRTVDGTVLGQSSILEADVPAGAGWVTAEFTPPVLVSPGTKHRIFVYSDQDSPSPDDRYHWRGQVSSSYCPSCDTDVSSEWPDYRYAFKTYGLEPCLPAAAPPTVGPPGEDLGLDALHLVGEKRTITTFLDAVMEAGYTREYWMDHPGELAAWLDEYGVDIWFSTEGTWTPIGAVGFLDGDLLSARSGAVVAENRELLPPGVPADVRNDGVDFGLDAATGNRAGDRQQIRFSTEILYRNELSFTDGDVLNYNNGIATTNNGLVGSFEPKADFLGLDAFHSVAVKPPVGDVYLPVVLRALGGPAH